MDATIVIPTFNRREVLARTLRALEGIECARDRWEVIVVDDGSTDGTESTVGAWLEHTDVRARYERQPNAGPATARNRGAAAARGRVLIFIDDDILVGRDFVDLHLETLSQQPECWVIGRIVHPAEIRGTPFGRYRDALWERFHDAHHGGGVAETGGMTAANLSLPAKDFERLGGFDQRFSIASCEDWDLARRARETGIRVVYQPRIVVVHDDWAISMERFCERQRLYSISDVLLFRKYREASPRAALVRDNGPIYWRRDHPRLAFKKALKQVLASDPGRRLLEACTRAFERLLPDSRLTWRAYDSLVAVAIFRGVREGVERYGLPDDGQAAAMAQSF